MSTVAVTNAVTMSANINMFPRLVAMRLTLGT
jgi:hypothetical protein